MVWGILIFVIGVLFGFISPGRENKWRLFTSGLLIGVILALVLWLLGGLAGVPTGAGVLGVIIGIAFLTLLFVLGAWIGDILEGAFRRKNVAP